MRSTLKLTLTALAVSVALTGCKSTEGAHVVADKKEEVQAVEMTKKTAKPNGTVTSQPNNATNKIEKTNPTAAEVTKPIEAKPITPIQPTEPTQPVDEEEKDEPAEPNKPVTPNEPAAPAEQPTTPAPSTTEQPAEPVKPEPVKPTHKPVNEDQAGKYWRVIALADGGNLSDGGDARRESRDQFVLPEEESHRSPFNADEDNKAYNYLINLDLGTQEQKNVNTKNLQTGESYLGKHSGQFQDLKLEGETIIAVNDDGEVSTGKADTVHYLYVNQPYSSYGAFYTNENDSNLFHIRLSTGRDGKKKAENGFGSYYAEYGVFNIVNGKPKWNENLIGDATYKGEVIARVEQTDGDKITASEPKFDGDVTLTLHLDNDWDKNKLVGHINSKTLGKITLEESALPETHAKISRDFISFNGETTVENSNFEGNYYTQFAGENLNDVVGKVELEADVEKGISKYNAVFGGTKQ